MSRLPIGGPLTYPPLVLAIKIDREDLAVELDADPDNLSRRYQLHYHRLSPNLENVLSFPKITSARTDDEDPTEWVWR